MGVEALIQPKNIILRYLLRLVRPVPDDHLLLRISAQRPMMPLHFAPIIDLITEEVALQVLPPAPLGLFETLIYYLLQNILLLYAFGRSLFTCHWASNTTAASFRHHMTSTDLHAFYHAKSLALVIRLRPSPSPEQVHLLQHEIVHLEFGIDGCMRHSYATWSC